MTLTPQTEDTVRASAKLRFEQVDLARLMRASGGYQGGGTIHGSAQVEGAGRSIADILGGADGGASLSMKGGRISSVLTDLAGLRLGSALLASFGASLTVTSNAS